MLLNRVGGPLKLQVDWSSLIKKDSLSIDEFYLSSLNHSFVQVLLIFVLIIIQNQNSNIQFHTTHYKKFELQKETIHYKKVHSLHHISHYKLDPKVEITRR